MSLRWIHESPAVWDRPKENVIGGVPEGALNFGNFTDGELLPGDWWRVERDGNVVGYGWMDITWGDAEILLAVDGSAQGQGVGSFILEQLDREARRQGINYLYNAVSPTHPEGERVTQWLEARGFQAAEDGKLHRRAVKADA